ncbi:hypothetical protein [Thermoflexus hugenholtzii]
MGRVEQPVGPPADSLGKEWKEWLREALERCLSPRGAKARMAREAAISPALLSRFLHGQRNGRELLDRLLDRGLKELGIEEIWKRYNWACGFYRDSDIEDEWFLQDLSDELMDLLRKGRHNAAWKIASDLLPTMWGFIIAKGRRLAPWFRPLFVETVLATAGLFAEEGDLGPLSLFQTWAWRAFHESSGEEFAAYLERSGSRMDMETLRLHMFLSLKGAEASLYQNLGAWRRAWEIRAEILEGPLKGPVSLIQRHRLGARVGQLLVLPRLPRFSIREALRLIHQIREDLERDRPLEPLLPDPERMRLETEFYANRGLLMAYARYGGDWLRDAERIVRINRDLEPRISSPLLKCSFYRAWADYLWRREPPGWRESVEVLDRALAVAEGSGLTSQRLKIAAEIRGELIKAKDPAGLSLLRRFAEERGLLQEKGLLMLRRG